MAQNTIHLPNGFSCHVTPIFGGMSFKLLDTNLTNTVLPPGWAIVIQTERPRDRTTQGETRPNSARSDATDRSNPNESAHRSMSPSSFGPSRDQRFTKPTLDSDSLFISSVFFTSDVKPAVSPTRQIALMLWATLWWYFHQTPPDYTLTTEQSKKTPAAGRPKGEWIINIRREGVLNGRRLMKLERMGLVCNRDSSVGLDCDSRNPSGWDDIFVSRRSFWQLDPRIFLFPLAKRPIPGSSPSPFLSQPGSPARDLSSTVAVEAKNYGASITNLGPFTSGSNLPTYFPPPRTEYTFTDGIRHPIRRKPPGQGEVFYVRYIPSVGQTLSFRVPILPSKGPLILNSMATYHRKSRSTSCLPDIDALSNTGPNDVELLHKWMNIPRVSAFWGVAGAQSTQEKFLREQLTSRHSFPAFGCWDGKPFGYFEIYWVKEDRLGRLIDADKYDRGLHCLVGEEEFRGPHRVAIWLSSLLHSCFLADHRTENVIMEPRVDNERFISHLQKAGFSKQGEVTFPHKQSALMTISRDSWEAPVL
ncbi:hypothetical protein AJ80_03762 [Polytolypa hystricis UAMH7299]|uniref:Acyltransferase MbtK/IucB-like conserved domain-containing protein n=1 Tax=Polytolypa hystricis (strain UAMH7299) TaxID=1447883 RepID=A0A2B7YF01_POLH7|nr:hypothetical protein AJ80_03762 [Polytolypa hystricis UAMH7299]